LKVCDRSGHPFQVQFFDDSTGWTLKVFAQNTMVGQVNFEKLGGDLFLADLHVFESAMPPITWLGRIKCLLGLKASGREINYRRRGLGSALLSFVVQRAHAGGFRRITGQIYPADLAENSNLPEWYRSRGFCVTMSPDLTNGTLELVLL
jgi:hypothetical protein